MEKFKIELENCFGIGKLSQEFSFSQNNSVLIYAPNGTMKTSFAKTLDCYSRQDSKDMPRDRVYANREPKYNIESDGNAINPQSILVVNAETEINTNDKITQFLASKELKERYDAIYSELQKEKTDYIKKLKDLSISTDCEAEVVSTFKIKNTDDFFSCLLRLENEVSNDYTTYTFKYNSIFDKKDSVKKFIDKNMALLDQYMNDYKNLLNESTFFNEHQEGTSFGTYQANVLNNSVSDNSFFQADHKIVLKGGVYVESSLDLSRAINDEIGRILNDEKLKATFDKIDKAIGANAELRAFKTVIEQNKTIIPLLNNYDEFRKLVWKGYFHKLQDETLELIMMYKQRSAEVQAILDEAGKENDKWEQIVDLYNKRFFVPFTVEVTNKEDVILKQKSANLEFFYKEKDAEMVKQGKNDLLNILSRGERRAYYILQMLFEIEARKTNGTESLIILDDIADSFDYKNKYAIVEYIKELNNYGQFKLIMLTHNFDFYRTIASRLSLNRENAYMVRKEGANKIMLELGNYRKDYFSKQLVGGVANIDKFISMIPFVRNIIEYTKGTDSDEYKLLTACLHIKQTSAAISASRIMQIYKDNINKCENKNITFGGDAIIQLILNRANELHVQDGIEDLWSLEIKIILSIAIRLQSEQFIQNQLTTKGIDYSNISGSQTAVLINLYEHNFSDKKNNISILGSVNLMTPEYIHVNTFMYEPLIDISMAHLVRLYSEVKNLEV